MTPMRSLDVKMVEEFANEISAWMFTIPRTHMLVDI